MRSVIAAVALLIALSGCMESQSSVDIGASQPSECWFLCGGSSEETTVHFDFFPLVLAIGLVVIALVVIAVAAGGRDGGQQQQQQVVIHVDERRR